MALLALFALNSIYEWLFSPSIAPGFCHIKANYVDGTTLGQIIKCLFILKHSLSGLILNDCPYLQILFFSNASIMHCICNKVHEFGKKSDFVNPALYVLIHASKASKYKRPKLGDCCKYEVTRSSR